MTSELSNKVAFVTGSASGIGRASVLALSGAGAAVAVLDRDEAGPTALVLRSKTFSQHVAIRSVLQAALGPPSGRRCRSPL